jgi:ABC-type multidrug transport system ATPase subunit
MTPVITVTNLSKSFSDVMAVNDISFNVHSGEVYGFLGQNGAGKSTTIRMLLTLIRPDTGIIEIFGMDLKKHRKEILRSTGAIIEKPDLYKYLTALENLRIFGIMSGVKLSTKDLIKQLDYVGLADRANSKVKTFSQGMKQRLGIAVALVHNPKLVILDEPINGLDPQGIADIRNLILRLSREEKKTVFISSHLLSEMELIADSLLIIDKGKKVVEGKMTDLINPQQTIVELETTDIDATILFLKNSSWKDNLKEKSGNGLKLEMKKEFVPELNRQLVNAGISVTSIHPIHSLEDYFLSKTKH